MTRLTIIVALATLTVPAFADGTEEWLAPPARIERQLDPCDTHEYRIRLNAGETLRGFAHQDHAAIVLTLLREPERTVLTAAEGEHGGRREFFVIPADRDAELRLVVASRDDVTGPLRYVLQVGAPTPTTDRDRMEAAGWNLLNATRGNDAPPLQQALALCEDAGAIECQASVCQRLGHVAWYRGVDLRGGSEFLRKSVRLWHEAGDRWAESEVLNDLGMFQRLLGDLLGSRESCEKAIPLRTTPDGKQEPLILHNCSPTYWQLGELQTALDATRKALAIWRAEGSRDGTAYALTVLGNYAYQLGDLDEASRYQTEALRIWIERGHDSGRAASTSRLGAILEQSGDRRGALARYRESLKLFASLGDRVGESQMLVRIGGVLLSLGETAAARRTLEEALAIQRAANCEEASALRGLGDVAAAGGDTAAARRWYEQAIAAVKSGEQTRLDVLLAIARLERNAGNLRAARNALGEATAMIESLRIRVVNPDVRASYLASQQTYFDLLIDVVMQLHRRTGRRELLREAFETSERARARGLLDSIALAGVRDRSIDTALAQREHEIRQTINGRAAALARLQPSDYDGARGTLLREEIATLSRDYQQIRTEIAQQRGSGPGEVLTLPAVQALLDHDTALLEYALGEERSHLWVITRRDVRALTLPGRAPIEKLVRRVTELMPRSYRRDSVAQTALAAARLGAAVLGPAMGLLAGKRLAIVADGALQFVPFAALSVPGSSRLLIESHEIVMLPSASVIASLRNLGGKRRPSGELALIADPVLSVTDRRLGRHAKSAAAASDLVRFASDFASDPLESLPFARLEIERIGALVSPSRQMRAVGFDASREVVLSGALEKYRHLHFATHGLLNGRHPELAGLVLTLYRPDGTAQDGFLRLNDIYNLRLNADLVVISACRSALGREVRREGLIGLTRGFMHAGAPRVVASLWDIRDAATAELMQRFYAHMLRDGMRPAAALRAAQLSMHADPRWKAPFYWAAFTLQGEWR